jgi:hypothetical protein
MRSFGYLQRVKVDSTGSYGAGLLRFMQQEGIAVLEVTTSDRQDRRRRGKNDDLDAQNAAHAAFEPVALTPVDGHATIRRQWSKGDAVTLDLAMPAERLYTHPNVRMDVGRTPLRRGPLIYCVEEADNPGTAVQTLALPRSAPLDAGWRTDLFGGVMTLKASAKRLVPGKGAGALYSTEPPAAEEAALVALPSISG